MIGIRTLTAGACLAAGSAFWSCGTTQSNPRFPPNPTRYSG
jgi:hypothetical protein